MSRSEDLSESCDWHDIGRCSSKLEKELPKLDTPLLLLLGDKPILLLLGDEPILLLLEEKPILLLLGDLRIVGCNSAYG